MLAGLEELLDYGREADMRFLQTANLQRDLLPKSAPLPVVLWLSPLAAAVLPKAAPDLWDWRGAGFGFTRPMETRADLLRGMVAMPFERVLGLSGERRRERAAMLEELLGELGAVGSPRSPREASERADLLGRLGSTYLDLGLAERALPAFDRQLTLAHRFKDRLGERIALNDLGLAHADLGEVRRAIEHYEQGLAIARETGDRAGQGCALFNGALALDQLGERVKAIEWLEAALAIAEAIENPLVDEARALLAEWVGA